MEITYKKRAPSTRLIKHVQKSNFPMILYKTLKNLLQIVTDGTDLVQLTHIRL